jgi:phosphoglycolate phosphatase-like HAD superfamily hydrolase
MTGTAARLALFDIDHTLVDVLRFHEPALELALFEVFGVRASLRSIQFSGQTTVNILRTLALSAGVSAPAVATGLPDALKEFTRLLIDGLDTDLRASVLPGVRPLLDDLQRRGLTLGVASGNPRAVGLEVLERADLDHHFSIWGFGDEAADRRGVVSMAVTRAALLLGNHLQPAQVVVVGDSIRDVEAAKAIGARAVALATGLATARELLAARPDHLLLDLTDTEFASRLIRGH